NYLQTDIGGVEASYRTIRVVGGSSALFQNGTPCPGNGSPCIDPAANTIFVGGIGISSAWTAGELAPTAAAVNITGRVLTAEGRGIRNAILTLTDQHGNVRRAITSSFGYYRFFDVMAGEAYILSIRSKRYRFEPSAVVVSVNDEVTNLDFVADP
ncbi:MAG: carboxypeptidase regulatory-like domain-containing protein, partial [Pyrinomonadaceae bacterium]